MKKVFFALAVVAMFSFAACQGNGEKKDSAKPAENTEANVNDAAAEDEELVEVEGEEALEGEEEVNEEA